MSDRSAPPFIRQHELHPGILGDGRLYFTAPTVTAFPVLVDAMIADGWTCTVDHHARPLWVGSATGRIAGGVVVK